MRNIIILLLFIPYQAHANNILLIGDSHSSGIFGKTLHQLLSQEFQQVTTLGHASSAPIDWLNKDAIWHSGGVFHQLYRNGQHYYNPRPLSHWSQKALVPYLPQVLANNAIHNSWRRAIKYPVTANIVVIELGANDARAISNQSGMINPEEYQIRGNAITQLIKTVHATGARCIWIGPPNGSKKPPANQKILYQFLTKHIQSQCTFMNSNHYKVLGCDGYHFNCAKERYKGVLWAKEAFNFIIKNI